MTAGSSGAVTRVELSVWPGFELPELDRVLPELSSGAVEASSTDETFHDAPDLRLTRSGACVSCRREGSEDARWRAEVPLPDGERAAVEADAPPDAVPETVHDLVTARVRCEPLQPVVRLQTARRAVTLHDPEGVPVIAVSDEETSVVDAAATRVAARFREVVVDVVGGELHPGAPEAVTATVARLIAAGAVGHDPLPRLARALGPRAMASPDVAAPDVDGDSPVGDVVRAALARALARIVDHDPVIRLDRGPEGVHQARVGTRRLRSDLRTFAPVCEPEWADALREELRWLAGELGAVRDREVLLGRLLALAGTLDDVERDAATRLLDRLRAERDAARGELLAGLRSDRYRMLLDDVAGAARAPRLGPDADAPSAEVLPTLAGRPFRTLRQYVGGLDDAPSDEALHRVRILAKRARYAAEAAAAAIPAAAAHASALADLQDVLGEQHDAVVAAAWLRDAARSVPADEAFAAGLLVAAEQRVAAQCRARWREVWRAADTKKVTAWLR